MSLLGLVLGLVMRLMLVKQEGTAWPQIFTDLARLNHLLWVLKIDLKWVLDETSE
jgi:hypothetical protein